MNLVFWVLPLFSLWLAATPELLRNGDFQQLDQRQFPTHFRPYAKLPPPRVVVVNGAKFLEIHDTSPDAETGLIQSVPAQPGKKYEVTVEAAAFDATSDTTGVWVQLRSYPGEKLVQTELDPGPAGQFAPTTLGYQMPPGADRLDVYIYTHRAPTPHVLVKSIRLAEVEKFTPRAAQSAGPNVPPIPRLKDLHLDTPFTDLAVVAGSSPASREAADAIRRAIAAKTGREVPLVDAATVKLPLKHSCVVTGNRHDNALMDQLYRRFFLFTDRAYPGPGGYEVRSLHNPTGGGFNVLIAGGSDADGIRRAGRQLAAHITAAPQPRLGFLQEIALPPDTRLPDPLQSESYWTLMNGHFAFGYGWNLIAANLALLYQTGDARYAREALRLAFPDARAIADLKKFNPESFDDPTRPLSAPYHYFGMYLMLLWDLVEEHPAFSDAERLRVTRAFADQMKSRGINPTFRYRPVQSDRIGTRHGQWGNNCMYVLGRYFERDYPNNFWRRVKASAEEHYRPLNDPQGWIEGERGVMNWLFSGAINPATQFVTLSGDRVPQPGALHTSSQLIEIFWDGTRNEVTDTASRHTFYQLYDRTGDAKWLFYAEKIGRGPGSKFKLGQSMLPAADTPARRPDELAGRWHNLPFPLAGQKYFRIAPPAGEVFLACGYRDTFDATGDFIAVNPFNAEYRTPYILMSLYGLRLNGTPVLAGLNNFVQTYADGLTEAAIPTVGRIRRTGVTGDTVHFHGSVPDHAHASWTRQLLLRKRRFAVIADTVESRRDGKLNIVQNWEFPRSSRLVAEPAGRLKLSSVRYVALRDLVAHPNGDFAVTAPGPNIVLIKSRRSGDAVTFDFSLEQPFRGEALLRLMGHESRAAAIAVELDGKTVKSDIPHHAVAGTPDQNIRLGRLDLAAGPHTVTLRVEKTAGNSAAIGAYGLYLLPPDDAGMVLATAGASAVVTAANGGSHQRDENLRLGEKATLFTLIAPEESPRAIGAIALDRHAALLQLPEKALAFSGYRTPYGEAELALLENDRLFATGTTGIAGLFRTTHPATVEWDLAARVLHIDPVRPLELWLPGEKFPRDIKAPTTLKISADAAALKHYRARLAAEAPAAATAAAKQVALRQLEARQIVRCAKTPSLLQSLEFAGQPVVALAAGKELTLLTPEGNPVRKFELDDNVQSVHGWTAAKLLLVGTRDNRVTAFGPDGVKRWEFRSELAPEVEKTQKYYWFKPAYPGIFALHSAPFFDGEETAMVGSACTMELLTPEGKLVARYPQTWGPTRQILTLRTRSGATNLVGMRSFSADNNALWTVNNRTHANTMLFQRNLPGYKNFPSFGSLFRTHIFRGDFDGDGEEELLGDSQGMYQWINVYSAEGDPKYQANLGPGDKTITSVFTVDLDVADFTGDARPEAVFVNKYRRLAALDGKCTPLWSVELEFMPEKVLALPKAPGAAQGRILVAGGRNAALYDGAGQPLARLNFDAPVRELITAAGRAMALTSDGTLWEIKGL